MGKLKASLMSFKAHGTVANELTYQDRSKGTMVRRKPVPIDRKTLPQMYQRWLYEDYVAWWHTLSAADKFVWETNARPYHMTGFAYWMKNRLTNLPDIVGLWHFDERSGSTAIDFSRNANHGTIHQALHVPGFFDYALDFDGLDDYVSVGNDESLRFNGLNTQTIEARIYPEAAEHGDIVGRKDPYAYLLMVLATDSEIWLRGHVITSGGTFVRDSSSYPINAWYHVAQVYDGTNLRVYVAGELDCVPLAANGTFNQGSPGTYIGSRTPATDIFNGIIDEVIIYNRALTAADVKRHAERRYPL